MSNNQTQSKQIAEKQSRQLTEKQTEQSKKDKNSKNNDADNNNNSKLNGNSVSFMTDFLNVINSIIKFLPLGFYFFTYFSATIYKDLKSVFLLIGLIINDIIGYLWKKYTNGTVNSNCNMFSSAFGDSANNSGNNNANGNGNANGNNNSGDVENDNNIYGQFMQNPHTEIVSFVASFFGADMFYKEKLDILPFTFLSITLFLTVWSMMNINCERKFGKIITNIVFGAIRGSVYYFIIKKYYLEAEKGKLEKETCDLGYNNYRCDEIKNGTVIIKDNSSKKDNNNNNDDDEEEDDDF